MAASALTIAGAAVGPVLAGLLAQYAALPLRLYGGDRCASS